MNELEYKNFYDRVGKLNGWDFSKVKCISEGVKWSLYSEVTQKCKKSDILLDIGTGGGEVLLTIAEFALLLVGVDHSNGMIQTANHNLETSNTTNVRFLQMDAQNLEFPQSFFNVVSCRHSPFYAKQVSKILVKDGVFLTQQVSESDKLNIKQAFGRGQDFRTDEGILKERYISELAEAGFTDIQSSEYNAVEYYATYEDLVFLLKYTPIIPNFGQNENDFTLLKKFIEENQTNKGIMTNSKRFMIIARK